MKLTTITRSAAPNFLGDPRRACKTADTELFFPIARNSGVAEAKAVCANCELINDCLAYALPITDLFGVWGGTSQNEREQVRAEIRKRNDARSTAIPAARQATS